MIIPYNFSLDGPFFKPYLRIYVADASLHVWRLGLQLYVADADIVQALDNHGARQVGGC